MVIQTHIVSNTNRIYVGFIIGKQLMEECLKRIAAINSCSFLNLKWNSLNKSSKQILLIQHRSQVNEANIERVLENQACLPYWTVWGQASERFYHREDKQIIQNITNAIFTRTNKPKHTVSNKPKISATDVMVITRGISKAAKKPCLSKAAI